jgi:2-hydroxy-6-oxonona-2,4-dienedioate hydrolase
MCHRRLASGSAALAAVLGYTLLRWGAWHLAREGRKREGRLGRLESRWNRVGPWRIHARVSVTPVPPDRPDVVLVHGLGVSSHYMLPIGEHLARDCRVHAPNLPGFGLSDKPAEVFTIRGLADALAAWMDAVGLAHACFLGNSFGNEIIVELALRYPDRVERIVLQGPTPEPSARNAP